jgi:fructan beta-fructosidase
MSDLYEEKYRPQFHYSAPCNWLNDPNGLVLHNGTYHLFYQYNPTGNDWGNMHWGHATSRDLVRWDNRPVALHAEPLGVGYIFSGCAVADPDNRSGLGAPDEIPLVALYTSCTTDGIQAQSLAFSLDDGETWRQYAENPVIENPGLRDFRDPKVYWHTDSERWVLVLAANDCIEFYRSHNLIDWEHVSRMSKPLGSNQGVWECPDLFPLTTDDGVTKWVLIVSACPEHSTRDESVQYFIGDFDGVRFEPDGAETIWLDYGADMYGAVTWDGVAEDDGRRIMIGWMSSWRYAREVPTYPWRGNMTIPRELRLVPGECGLELATMVVRELENIRTNVARIDRISVDDPDIQAAFADLSPELLDLDLTFEWPTGDARSFGVRFTNSSGETLDIVVNSGARTLVVDRTTVGQCVPNPKFARRFEAPMRETDGLCKLRVIKDRASVEVFADGGRAVISANLFYDLPFEHAELFCLGDVDVSGEISTLKSIWTNDELSMKQQTT